MSEILGHEVLASHLFQAAWIASLALGVWLLRFAIPSIEVLVRDPFRATDRVLERLFFAAARLLFVFLAVVMWAFSISPWLAYLTSKIVGDPWRFTDSHLYLILSVPLLFALLGGAVATRHKLLRGTEMERFRLRSATRDSDRLLALLCARSGPAARFANARCGCLLERVLMCLPRFEGSLRGGCFLQGLIATRGSVTGDGECWLAVVARGATPNMECFVIGLDLSPLALASSRTDGVSLSPPVYRFCLGPGAIACEASAGSDVVAVARAGGFVDVFRHDCGQPPSNCLVPVAIGLGGVAPDAYCPQELVVSVSHDGGRVGLLVPLTRELVVFDVRAEATVARLSVAGLAHRGEVLDQDRYGYPFFEPGASLFLSWDGSLALVSNGGREGVVLDVDARRGEDSVVARPSATCPSLREGMIRWTWTGPGRACLVAQFEEGGSSWFAWDGDALRELGHVVHPFGNDVEFAGRIEVGERALSVAPVSWPPDGDGGDDDRTVVGILQNGAFVWRRARTGELVPSPVGDPELGRWLPSSEDLRGTLERFCWRVVWRRSRDARLGRERDMRVVAWRVDRGGAGVEVFE